MEEIRQPDKYIDNKTIALLTEHPGETPEEPVYGQVGCGDGVDSSCSTSRAESLASTMWRIQAWEEILKYPEQATNKPTSTG